MSAVLDRPFATADVAHHGWRLTPDRLAAHVTRNDEVTPGFGGDFDIAGPYQRPQHVRYLGRALGSAIAAGNGRIIINQPPQTGKSTLTSKWTPVWAHHLTNGRARVLLGAYQARFAATWGNATMDAVKRYGGELMLQIDPAMAARDVWQTTGGGGMQTGGVDGSMTGKPGDIIVIDDPFKNFKEAHSPTVRQDVWDWFWAVPMTRLQPGTTVIVVHTRWHEDDLTGRLMSSETAHRWTQIRLPAICENEHDLLGRKIGQSIWPQRFNEAHYADVEEENGPYRWAGMYQQRPAPLAGELFKRTNWQYVDAAPATMQLVRRWDLAATQDGGDYTAGVLMGRTDRGQVFILDVQHERLSSLGVEDLIKETAKRDADRYGKRVRIRLEQEPGSAGKSVAANYVSVLLAGYSAKALPSTGSKEIRALPLAAQHEAQNVNMVRRLRDDGTYETPTWFAELEEEAAVFPNGAHDDMVDAASQAFNDLIDLAKVRKRAQTRTMAKERIGDSGPVGGGPPPPR